MGYIAYRILRKRGSGRRQEVSLFWAGIIIVILIVCVILSLTNHFPGMDNTCYNTAWQSGQVCTDNIHSLSNP